MTRKQKINYNRMLYALRSISKYQTPAQLRRRSRKDYGLSYEEALEFAYENIRESAKVLIRGVRKI